MKGDQVQVIPRRLRVIYDAYASFPASGLVVGDLAYGTDTFRLYRWSGAAWQPISATGTITTGTYTGNNGTNRAIPHGIGFAPKIVIITQSNSNNFLYFIVTGIARIQTIDVGPGFSHYAVTALDATNFYVGNGVNHSHSANGTTEPYSWVAIG